MKRFVIYSEAEHVAWGRAAIIRAGICPDDMLAIQAGVGEMAVEIADDVAPSDYFVEARALAPLADSPATVSGLVVSNLPIPSRLRIESVFYTVNDGTATLHFSQPGAYTVTCYAAGYRTKQFRVISP